MNKDSKKEVQSSSLQRLYSYLFDTLYYERRKQLGSSKAVLQSLKIPQSSWHSMKTNRSIPNADFAFGLLDRIGGSILLPHESSSASLQCEVELRQEIDKLRSQLEEAEKKIIEKQAVIDFLESHIEIIDIDKKK